MKSIISYFAIVTVLAANLTSTAHATGLIGIQSISRCQVVGDALEAKIVQASDLSQFVLCRLFRMTSPLGRDAFQAIP